MYYVLGTLPILSSILDQGYEAHITWTFFIDEKAEGQHDLAKCLSSQITGNGIEIQHRV